MEMENIYLLNEGTQLVEAEKGHAYF